MRLEKVKRLVGLFCMAQFDVLSVAAWALMQVLRASVTQRRHPRESGNDGVEDATFFVVSTSICIRASKRLLKITRA